MIPDSRTNREPPTGRVIRGWGYGAPPAMRVNTDVLVPLAAVAEMCDQTYYDAWDDDLEGILRTP